MNYAKTALILAAWFHGTAALLYGTLHLMGDSGKWPLFILVAAEIGVAAFIAFKRNFVNECLGKALTFIVLIALMVCGVPMLFYISMFVYGETL